MKRRTVGFTAASTINALAPDVVSFATALRDGRTGIADAGSAYPPEAKLDVAVDFRADSPTFGRWISAVLSPDDNNQLWVPAGFGHGFCTLEPNTVIGYRVTSYYSRENDKGVAWNDPDIAVSWPDIADPETLSPKDRAQPSLRELPRYFSVKDGQCA